jgi:spore germination cell wall hydrolase CwlJ-like protein
MKPKATPEFLAISQTGLAPVETPGTRKSPRRFLFSRERNFLRRVVPPMWGLRRAAAMLTIVGIASSCSTGPAGPSPDQIAALEAERAAEAAREEERRRAAALPRYSAEDMHCLAITIYWEGKGETRTGQVAVAHVVLNRLADPRFPKTICGVVHEGGNAQRGRCQFSWWCDGKSDDPTNAAQWKMAQEIARAETHPGVTDPTGGALYFHHRGVKPGWSRTRIRTASIGGHHFYR